MHLDFWIMFVTALYTVYVILTFYCAGNKAFMKVYQWFQILYFEKSLNLSQGPNTVLFDLAKFLLETLFVDWI